MNLLRHSNLRVVVFPSLIHPACPEFEPYRIISSALDVDQLRPGDVGMVERGLVAAVANSEVDRARGYIPMRSYIGVTPELASSPASLVSIIRALRPDLVHSLELQHSGYLCLEARRRLGSEFPRWLASSWGSDIYLYRKMPEHVAILRELLDCIDALHSDCARDLDLAVEMGFRGRHFPVVSGAGGADLASYPDFAKLAPPSQRNVIVVKGNHGWAGRGINVLMAIHRIAPLIRGFRVRVTHSSAAVRRTVEAIAREDGLDISLDPYYPNHSSAMERLAEARLVVGAGISDGATVTLLEAMTVGAFSVLSDTSCAHEWITPGRTGLIVSPHDIAAMGAAIIKAITDDALVDKAAALNRLTIERRWSSERVRPIVMRGYQDVIEGAHA